MDTANIISLVGENIGIVIVAFLVIVGALIVYFTLLVRAIIQMLKHNASSVLLTFSFISLIPFPLVILLGIMILIIWHFHKKELLAK